MRFASKGPHKVSTFRRAGLVVLIGNAAGAAVALMLTPVIAKLYQPDVFGTFATVTAVASIFVGVSTFRLEVLAQRVRDDGEAAAALRFGFISAVAWGAVLTILGIAAVLWWGAAAWWLAVGGLVTICSMQLLGTAVLLRSSRYRALALHNFVQGAGAVAAQASIGWFSTNSWSLLTGFALARLSWVGTLTCRRPHGKPSQRTTWLEGARFGVVAGSSAAINSLAGQLPVIASTWLFGAAQAGFLAMAFRILIGPLSLAGQAAAAATLGEIGRSLREQSTAVPQILRKAMRDLLLIGLIPCVLVALFGMTVVPVLLGEQWRESGLLVTLMSVGALAQFVVAPFSQLLNLTGHSRVLLVWDLARLACVAASFGLPAFFARSHVEAVAAYSGTLLAIYALLAVLCHRSVSNSRES